MTSSFESPTGSPDVLRLASQLLFGTIFNWALYGVLCVQIYVYSYHFPEDRGSLKFTVYFVFLLETAQTALTGADIYYWFIAGFGNVEHLENSHFGAINIPIISAVIAFIVHGYFCHRIWSLRWSSWICWIIAVASVIQSITAMWMGIKSLAVSGRYIITKTALYLWSISIFLADILIAMAMTLLLRRATLSSTFVLTRVIRLTIETNTLTACLALAILVLYAAFPNELHYISITQIIGKVYSNTLLVSLNNRIYFREHELPQRHGDSAYLKTSNPVRAAVQSSLRFAVPEEQPQTTIGDNFQLRTFTITRTVELDKGKGDDTSINSSPFCPRT